jgi:hypothetical protein
VIDEWYLTFSEIDHSHLFPHPSPFMITFQPNYTPYSLTRTYQIQ